MIRYKVACIILLISIAYVSSEESISKEAQPRILKPPDKTLLKKSFPYDQNKPEKSFMSKIASWIFPFGSSESSSTNTDQVPAADGSGARAQYLPPSKNGFAQHSSSQEDCNPCNQEPWIPMASNIGHQTVIKFVPPSHGQDSQYLSPSSHNSDLSHLEQLHPPNPLKFYGAPIPQFKPRPPKRQNNPVQFYGPPPKPSYGAPALFTPSKPQDNYGPPPPLPSNNYGPPPQSQYGPPKPHSDYGPPPKPHNEYGPPPKVHSEYGPPPKPHNEYGPPPKPHNEYGPPPKLHSEYGPPPKPHNEYGPPPKPQNQYGPPPNIYRPPPKPHSDYGPPPKPHNNYGPPPSRPQNNYGLPPSHHGLDHFAPPRPQSQYNFHRAPKPNYGAPPRNNYGPPKFNPIFAPPRAPPSFNYGPPVIPTTHLRPVNNQYGPPKYPSVSPPKVEYGVPFNTHEFAPPTLPSTPHLPKIVPSDSYGAPVTGNVVDFFPNYEQLPLSSGDNEQLDKPIPLPNLSSSPVLPIYNSGNFKQDFSLSRDVGFGFNNNEETSVQIVPSIKVADFLSTIEHPINVVQSPIVDLSVKEESLNFEETTNPSVFRNNLQDSYGAASIKLSENPIFVEDANGAATNINSTYASPNGKKRDNEKNVGNPGTLLTEESKHFAQIGKDNEINSDLLKKLLLDHGILGNPNTKILDITKGNNKTKFTPPPMDYSSWEPSYPSSSIMPPRMGPSTWLEPVNGTTKKPKQIQIIIPYVTKSQQYGDKNYGFYKNQPRKVPNGYQGSYTTLVPVYTPPLSTEESIWSKYIEDFNIAESKRVTATAFTPPSTTSVQNIRDLLNKGNKDFKYDSSQLPYDIISLQKNIDHWTQQEYSRLNKISTISDFKKTTGSKKIPDEYFTTQPYSETTTQTSSELLEGIENNLIVDYSTSTTTEATISTTSTTTTVKPTIAVLGSFPIPFSVKGQKSFWDVKHVTVSPHTKEKVYVVTPQSYQVESATPATAWSQAPKIENGKVNADSTFTSKKFSVRVETDNDENKIVNERLKKDTNSTVKVVYSEWPHIINSLQTTSSPRPTSRHPLFGLMDYIPPSNGTVETFFGHSKVVSVVTPSNRQKQINSTTPFSII